MEDDDDAAATVPAKPTEPTGPPVADALDPAERLRRAYEAVMRLPGVRVIPNDSDEGRALARDLDEWGW